MTIGGENSTSTLNLVGFSSGVVQLAPLEMAPWDLMEITCPHMGIYRTISQTQWKASHLLRPGNPHPAAARTISMSSSIRTGAPLNLFLLRDISQHLNLLGANPTIISGLCPEETPACNETIRTESEVGGEETENCKVPDELDNANLPPLPMAPRPAPAQAQRPEDLAGHLVPPPGHHIVHAPPQPENLV